MFLYLTPKEGNQIYIVLKWNRNNHFELFLYFYFTNKSMYNKHVYGLTNKLDRSCLELIVNII